MCAKIPIGLPCEAQTKGAPPCSLDLGKNANARGSSSSHATSLACHFDSPSLGLLRRSRDQHAAGTCIWVWRSVLGQKRRR